MFSASRPFHPLHCDACAVASYPALNLVGLNCIAHVPAIRPGTSETAQQRTHRLIRGISNVGAVGCQFYAGFTVRAFESHHADPEHKLPIGCGDRYRRLERRGSVRKAYSTALAKVLSIEYGHCATGRNTSDHRKLSGRV